jgi:D-alanyl-D-alanine carboxypeptidase (penicillin-binding protein 5/6)
MHARENASATLLGYGFTFYDTRLVAKAGQRVAATTVWKADDPALELGVARDLYVTVQRGKGESLKPVADIRLRLVAPLKVADSVGELRVFAGSQTVATAPLHPLRDVPTGSLWRRLVDTVRLWFN